MATAKLHGRDGGCFLVGSLSVRVRGVLPHVLSGLGRAPVDTDCASAVELSVEVADSRTWDLGIAGSGANWRKGVPGHLIEVDLLARHVSLRVVAGDLSRRARHFLFRDIFCFLGALSGDMLAHAAGIVHDGEAILFCALAGGGKSTIASMFAGCCDVISDEINWVHEGDGEGLAVVNQPFWRPSGEAELVPILPLRAVYVLEKAGECSIGPVSVSEAFPVLLAAPFGGGDPMLRPRSEATARCASLAPLRKLRFSLAAGAVRRLVLGDVEA